MRSSLSSKVCTFTAWLVAFAIISGCGWSSAQQISVSAVPEDPPPTDAPAFVNTLKKKKKELHPKKANADLMLEMKDLEDQAEVYNQKAIRLFEAGRYEEAQEMWQKAIGLVEGPAEEGSLDEFTGLPVFEGGGEEGPEEREGPGEASDIAGPPDGGTGGGDASVQAQQDRQRQEAVEEIYKDAIGLYRNGDFDRARERLEEVQWLLPGYRASEKYLQQIESELTYEDQMQPSPPEEKGGEAEEHWKDVVEETEHRRRGEMEGKAEALYRQAVDHFEEERFKDAREKFEETEVFYPGYKNTQEYLARIEERLLEDQEVVRREESRLEKKLLEKEESEFDRAVRERELERMKGVQEKADVLYEKAIQLYKEGQYPNAKIRFAEVDVLFPDYKFTRKYLARIDQDITREEKERLERKRRQETLAGKRDIQEWQKTVEAVEQGHEQRLKKEAERIYQQARQYYSKGDVRKARLYFQETGRAIPHYKSTDKFIARINQDLVKERHRRLDRRYRWKVFIEKQEEDRLKATRSVQKEKDMEALRQRVEPLYLEAKALYQRGDFKAAKQKFKDVVREIPDYKSSLRFLDRLDEDIRRQEQYKAKESKRAKEHKERIRRFFKERRQERSGRTRQWQKEGLGETLAHIKEVRQETSVRKAQALYEAGQADYRNRLPELALEKFLEIERIIPGYKSTRRYLERINGDIEGKEQEWSQGYLAKRQAVISAAGQKEEGLPPREGPSDAMTSAQQAFFETIKNERLARQADGTSADEPVLRREEGSPAAIEKDASALKDKAQGASSVVEKEKDLDQASATTKEEKPRVLTKKKADPAMKRAVEKAYQEALRYLNRKKYHSAQLKVNEAQRYLADAVWEESFVRAQEKKLGNLRDRIQRAGAPGREEEKSVNPQGKAKAEGAPVKRVKTDDPLVAGALRKIEDQKEQVRRERARVQESFQKRIRQTYAEAVRLYKKESLQEARALFLGIDGVSADYKKTRDYLEKIRKKIGPAQGRGASKVSVPAAAGGVKADIVSKALDQWEAEQ